jgi:hypothetical protein
LENFYCGGNGDQWRCVRVGRHTLDWIEDKGLRADTTKVLNKGEARHTLALAVAFHRLGRFRDRSHERQSHRAAALNLVTACIGLFNCRYLGRAVADLRQNGVVIDDWRLLRRLSPLGWDHINLTGDYVWSETAAYDADGMRPLNRERRRSAARNPISCAAVFSNFTSAQ